MAGSSKTAGFALAATLVVAALVHVFVTPRWEVFFWTAQ